VFYVEHDKFVLWIVGPKVSVSSVYTWCRDGERFTCCSEVCDTTLRKVRHYCQLFVRQTLHSVVSVIIIIIVPGVFHKECVVPFVANSLSGMTDPELCWLLWSVWERVRLEVVIWWLLVFSSLSVWMRLKSWHHHYDNCTVRWTCSGVWWSLVKGHCSVVYILEVGMVCVVKPCERSLLSGLYPRSRYGMRGEALWKVIAQWFISSK